MDLLGLYGEGGFSRTSISTGPISSGQTWLAPTLNRQIYGMPICSRRIWTALT